MNTWNTDYPQNKMESFNLQRFENETEDAYTYRLLGSADEWVFEVNDEESLPEGVARNIFKMYTEISAMPSDELCDEMHENERMDCYRAHTIDGAWCRTWCRIAYDVLRFRDE